MLQQNTKMICHCCERFDPLKRTSKVNRYFTSSMKYDKSYGFHYNCNDSKVILNFAETIPISNLICKHQQMKC